MTLEQLRVIITAETSGLKKAVKTVQSQLNGLKNTVSKVTNGIKNQFNNLSKSINNSFKGLARLVGLTAMIAGLVKLGKAAVQAASDLEEIQNVVNVVFGDSAAEIDQWAKSALKNFGMVESEAKDVASTFKAMANGMGVADKSGKVMSLRLAELAADLASFRNTSVEQARTALSGVFTGETEALKKFGVVMTEANLKAYALSQGITKSYSAMSQAEKVALRYNYVLHATADAQGDFARSSGSWANQIKVLKGQWTSFLGVLGTAITQIFAPLVQALNKVLEVLITITKTAFAAMGIDFSVQSAKVSSGLGDAADAAGDITDGIGDATQAAKELYHELAPFDELNLLGDKSKDSGSSGGGGIGDAGGGGLDIADAEVKLEKTEDLTMKSLEEMLNDLNDWFENTMGPWLKEKAHWLAEKINEFVDNTPWDLLGYTAANGLNQIIYALDEFFTTLKGYNIGNAFADFINAFVDKFDAAAFGKMIGDKIKLGLDIAIGFLENFDGSKFGQKLADFFNNLDIPTIAGKIGKVLSEAIKAGLDIAIAFLQGTSGEDLRKAWENFWDNIDFEGIRQRFITLFDEIGIKIDEIFGSGTVDKIKAVAEAIGLIAIALAAVDFASFLLNLEGVVTFMTHGWNLGIKGIEGLGLALGNLFGALVLAKLPDGTPDWVFQLLSVFSTAEERAEGLAGLGQVISNGILAIGNAVAHPIQTLQAAFGALGTMFTNLGTTITGFVTSIPSLLASGVGAIGTFFSGMATTVTTAVGNIAAYISANGVLGTAMNGLKAVVAALQGGVKALFAVLAAHPFVALAAAIAAVVASVIYLWNTCDTFKQFFVDIWENTIKPMFDQVAERWKGLIDKIKELWDSSLKPCVQSIWTVVKEIWDKIAHVIGAVIMTLTPVVTGVIGIVSGLLTSLADIFGDIIDIISGVLDFITGVFTGDWEKAWNGVKKIFKGVWDGFVDICKAPINALIGLINGMLGGIVAGVNAIIRKINSLKISIPEWVPGVGGKSIGFNLSEWSAPSIPFLAKGGVIEDPTLAMIGEYPGAKENPEIVAPQNILRDTMVQANGDMVGAIYQMAQQIIAAIENVDMNVTIGDDTIASAAKRGSDDYRRRTGKPMFAIS